MSAFDDRKPFDIRGPLPTGTTVLEASAGTGKTHAIGALVTRYVAEGAATLDELLVITFGRAASQELRERVRGHLVDAERVLADPAAARSGGDELYSLLAAVPDEELRTRRERLRTALAGFDAATIVTTHQFCQYVLTGLGIAGDADADVELVESLDDLVVEVVDDLYVRAFAGIRSGEPIFDRATALALARKVIDDPQAELVPAGEEVGTAAARRVAFGGAVRAEVDRRKRQRRILGYDDLLTRLATALEPPDAAARQRMRARWSIVLVDEFQDTDPVQWQILERAFADHAVVVLVGDPKQSIYAFRGGDIDTYLAAAQTAGAQRTLVRNWRADAPLVTALQVLFGEMALGGPDILVRPVSAVTEKSRLVGAPSSAPLRLRVVRRDDFGIGRNGKIPIDRVRKFVARDLTADVSNLLGSGASFDGRSIAAGDIAVIVGTHLQANLIRENLTAAGIPAVVAGNVSVFHTRAGDDWLVLLEALEQPHRSGRVRAAALSPFVGKTAAQLAAGGERLTDELSALFSRWAAVLAERGVAALLEVATTERDLRARVLAQVDGERQLTDLRHVGQALYAAALDEGLGLTALTEWLRRRRADTDAEIATDRIRRLDTDAAATQVVTLHASKGLQYPVVYLPFAFDRFVRAPDTLLLHVNGQRVIDIGGSGTAGRSERQRQALAEESGEALRLLYVGLTRAQSQVVTWWAPTKNTPCSGLHRVAFGRRDLAGGVPDEVALVADDLAARQLKELEQRGGPVVEPAAVGVTRAPAPPLVTDASFAIGILDRPVDTGWRRVSYSSLSAAGTAALADGVDAAMNGAAAGDAGVGSEPESAERADEAIPLLRSDSVADQAMLAVPSPMAELPAGTSFGTLVHAVLEVTDPQAPDLAAELRERCAEQLAHRAAPLTPDQLAQALLPVLQSPLGPLAPGITLRDIPIRDRLAELEFELPLRGGDESGGGGTEATITLGELAPVLRRYLAPDEPLARYADRLASPGFSWLPLRGYLTGSLDAVLRLPGPRYLVVDYKTNWLGEIGGAAGPGSHGTVPSPGSAATAESSPPAGSVSAVPQGLSAWHYRPDALDTVMAESDYPLQALLYCVALHRFLRWRQPGYDPAAHIGGVLYLFVRGMCGPATPLVDGRPCGIFGWQPPVELVTELSDLLDGAGWSARPAGGAG